MNQGDEWRPSQEWRPLTDNERQLLEVLTDQDFPAAEQLHGQVSHARAQAGCGCGCGTINLDVDRELAPRAELRRQPSQGEADVADSEGQSIGGLILFARDGYLSCLEIYTWGDPALLPLPGDIRPFVRAD